MKEKFFITTSIAYANAAPHIGHAYEIALTDIIARYKRMRGFEIFFLTGTDEHGDKILRAAKDAGKAPQVFVDENAKKFEALYQSLAISYDYFIRTSDKKNHWPGAQALWQKLLVSNDLYKGVYKGLYCLGCEAFITEKELIDGKCPNHNTVPETIEEENYFFRLSKYGSAIQKAIESRELNIVPESRAHEVLSMIKEGVRDISFSRPERDVLWGIPVPNDQKQMMYVWCDALSNYISALGYGRTDNEKFKRFWPADMHMIGKDILRFHAGIWIAMLLAAKLPLPKAIYVHGYITSEGQKMSKSLGNVVDPFEVGTKYGVEPLRYYLLREIPTTDDGDFSTARFEAIYDGELANNLGNLTSRVLTMNEKYSGGKVPPVVRDDEVVNKVLSTWKEYQAHMNDFNLKAAAESVFALLTFVNHYIDVNKPWELAKKDPTKVLGILYHLLEILRHVSLMLTPFLPETAKKIKDALNFEGEKLYPDNIGWGILKEGTTIKKIEPLFPRLALKNKIVDYFAFPERSLSL